MTRGEIGGGEWGGGGWGGGRGGEGVVKGVEDVEGRGVFGVGGLLFIVDTKPRPQMTPSPSAWRVSRGNTLDDQR